MDDNFDHQYASLASTNITFALAKVGKLLVEQSPGDLEYFSEYRRVGVEYFHPGYPGYLLLDGEVVKFFSQLNRFLDCTVKTLANYRFPKNQSYIPLSFHEAAVSFLNNLDPTKITDKDVEIAAELRWWVSKEAEVMPGLEIPRLGAVEIMDKYRILPKEMSKADRIAKIQPLIDRSEFISFASVKARESQLRRKDKK